MPSPSIAALVLAGGASSRLGRPKQLLSWKGETLLSHAIQRAKEVMEKVYVVVGAFPEEILLEVEKSGAEAVMNPHWQEGMASSLRCGVEKVFSHEKYQAVLILLCDQPALASGHLQNLIHLYHPIKNPIVASLYEEKAGVPALFDRAFLPDLMDLQGDRGARILLEKYSSLVTTLPFPQGSIDIDTEEDWQKWL